MRFNYLTMMFYLYVLIGATIGILFSLALPTLIPLPGDWTTLFTISSIMAGIVLGVLNFTLFYVFTRKILSYFLSIFKSIEVGDFSVRSRLKSKGFLHTFSTSVNQTLASLEETQATVFTDDLTGISNRSALQAFTAEMKKRDRHYYLYFLDLDDFKEINDCYGHAAGDQVLKHFATTISSVLEKGEFFFRYGGDEFIVIQPNENGQEGIDELCEAMQEALSTPCLFEGKALYIQTSIGIAPFHSKTKDLSSVIKQADEAMYEAKKQPEQPYVQS